jgi:hypothetical protein
MVSRLLDILESAIYEEFYISKLKIRTGFSAIIILTTNLTHNNGSLNQIQHCNVNSEP